MGQSAEQSRDDFKDVRWLEVFSSQNSRRNSEAKHFSKCFQFQLITKISLLKALSDQELLRLKIMGEIVRMKNDDIVFLTLIIYSN